MIYRNVKRLIIGGVLAWVTPHIKMDTQADIFPFIPQEKAWCGSPWV
ncbi:MAG: hypothetical protein IJY24_01135 [Clostridia bacterium]|nr:hypothetical protein [Clostridia bacterium]